MNSTAASLSSSAPRTDAQLRALKLEKLRRLETRVESARFDWRVRARPDQLAPEGEWRVWLILAGRGWGKSRSGAEWVREQVTKHGARRVALVARTAADVRDVIVEGESGLLAISPESERPRWEPSRRRLTWPNGAIATTYSADVPDQLRGPQHDCFVAGTMVVTADGSSVPIETLNVGDEVMTREGPRRVVAARSRDAEVVTVRFENGAHLTGTGDHPVLTQHGWVGLASLHAGHTVCLWADDGGPTGKGTSTATNAEGSSTVTACSGRSSAETSQTGGTFTTSTESRETTGSRTSRSCLLSTTEQSTPSPETPPVATSATSSVCGQSSPADPLGARSASDEKPTRSAPPLRESASTAASSSPVGGATTAVSGASTSAGVGRVFNLTVDGAHEFYANGVLVHNCAWADELAAWPYPDAWRQLLFGLRLGADPRVVVTTTPRPTPIIRALVSERTTHVTRGRTLDNAANLAPQFLDAIVSQFQGTRLGRQELDGEILDDNPGALWRRSSIDAARVTEAPDLRRIVVGVDPAVSATAQSDETGIVVAGLGLDGRWYVLADYSGRYAPDQWAARVVHAFRTHRADRVIAESNQGGDLVVANLRTVDSTLPVTTVHAKRGKALRAEPVASLYEQGRVSHVGTLAALEDQMTAWDPSGDAASPDRVDALVYAVTELSASGASPAYMASADRARGAMRPTF